jgi:hypothetical protein
MRAPVRASGWQNQLDTCEVLPGELACLYRLYGSTINVQAAERCGSALHNLEPGNGASETLHRIQPQLENSTWTGPIVAFACQGGPAVEAWTSSYVRSVVAHLAQTLEVQPPLNRGFEDEDLAWVRYGLDVFEADTAEDGRDSIHLVPVGPASADHEALTTALSLLRRSWPEMAELIDTLVRQIVWYLPTRPGRIPKSGTVIKTFGAIFLTSGNDSLSVMEYLVHEATHLDLIMRLSADRLITNRDHLGQSPFRRQKRPLIRVLHAALVTARIRMAYERCAGSAGVDSTRCREQSEWAKQSLADALSGLQEAEWTPTGAKLAEALKARA